MPDLGIMTAKELAADLDAVWDEKSNQVVRKKDAQPKTLCFNAGTTRQIMHDRAETAGAAVIEKNDLFIAEQFREPNRYFWSDHRNNGWCQKLVDQKTSVILLGKTNGRVLVTPRGYFKIQGDLIDAVKPEEKKK